MIEKWETIKGFQYEVSNMGKVCSLYRMVRCRKDQNILHSVNPRILKLGASWGGYQVVGLSKDGKPRSFRVHTLVLEAFVSKRPKGMECRHLDGNPANNKLDNLRWGTSQENGKDAVRHGRIPHPNSILRGEAHGAAKLTAQQVKEIRSRYKGLSGMETMTSLAREFGVVQWTVSRIIKRRTWKHI